MWNFDIKSTGGTTIFAYFGKGGIHILNRLLNEVTRKKMKNEVVGAGNLSLA